MSKVLERRIFNNGYGCSCCRDDWEETSWIDENEMIDFQTLLTEAIKELQDNVWGGGIVGIVYEKDGKILYGVDPYIYKMGATFYAVFGGECGEDGDYENELMIKDYEGVYRYDKSYTVDEILLKYNNKNVEEE